MKTINVVDQFRAICGEYSMNKMEAAGGGNWSANLFRGAKKIGVVTRRNFDGGFRVEVNGLSGEELVALNEWADRAGPLGFADHYAFVEYIYNAAQILIVMRLDVRRGLLVAFDRRKVDDHEMPLDFKSSTRKVNREWLDGYAKSHPEMQVVNDQVA